MSWLREYVRFDQSVDELASRITLAGLEIKRVERAGQEWANIFVGEVERVEPHPDADSLVLATVGYGTERLTVVTGAPNIEERQKVALALQGAVLNDAYSEEPRKRKLKPSKIRGVRSEGMVCSAKELGLGDEHEGILVLGSDAPVGAPLAQYLGDEVLEIDLTPNFAYANSVIGVAREAAAIVDGRLQQLAQMALPEGEAGCAVTVEGPHIGSRYMLQRLDGISVRPSPQYIQERLRASGLRSINNVVDVTNYVMLEYGQPLHAFDTDRVSGSVIVRTAFEGEQFETLDHQRRTMPHGTIMIADPERAIGIGGIMGGLGSEVTDSTNSILLEAATFDPVQIRRSARAMGMRTDASSRFEKGLDPELAATALARAVELLAREAGAQPVGGPFDWYVTQPPAAPVRLTAAEARRQLGVDVPVPEMERILTALGFKVQAEPDAVIATPPSWRRDVTRPADLVEEVGRIYGYDHLPSVLPEAELPLQRSDNASRLERRVRDYLAAAGLQEVINYDLTSPQALEPLRPLAGLGGPRLWESPDRLLKVLNPLSSEREYLRPSLLGGLLQNVRDNARHSPRVWLYELDRVFVAQGADLPLEPKRLAMVLTGPRWPASPHLPVVATSIFHLKGVIEGLLKALNVSRFELVPVDAPPPGARDALAVEVGGRCAGYAVTLDAEVLSAAGLDQTVVATELAWDVLLSSASTTRTFQSFSRFPRVVQDSAVELAESTSAAAVEAVIRRHGGKHLRQAELIEVYRGASLAPGTKSLLYRLSFGSDERTLTEDEASRARRSVERALSEQLGARLRGSEGG